MLRVMSAGAAGAGCASCTAAACGDGTGATAWSGACAGAARTVAPASKLWPQLAPVHLQQQLAGAKQTTQAQRRDVGRFLIAYLARCAKMRRKHHEKSFEKQEMGV